ncbi:SIR2-like domain containing protein [Fimbriimonadaceae bacterium]
MSIKSDLETIFSNARSAPILFAGAGFSRRYLKTPDWKTLLSHFAAKTDFSYDYYRSLANDNLPEAGKLIAEQFHKIWFTSNEYAESREKYQHECRTKADPLKYEVSQYLNTFDTIHDDYNELQNLRDISLEAIITTNYDQLFEKLFDSYTVYSSQDALILEQSFGAGELYKIHGTTADPSSIIITSDDYDYFRQRNIILAAKLLTLIVEHPVVFLGYSLLDDNIRTILASIVKCLPPAGLKEIQNNIVIVEWNIYESENVSKRSFRIEDIDLPYTHISCHGFQDLFESMSSFERRIPVNILRELKKSIYQLVENSDPKGRLVVLDIENAEDLANADFVIGVGVQDKLNQVGYTGLGRDDLFRFVLYGGEYDASMILSNVVPNLAKGKVSCPVFRFLNESGRITDTGIDTSDLSAILKTLSEYSSDKYIQNDYRRHKEHINANASNLNDVISQHGENGALYRIALLAPEKLDLDSLCQFLKDVEPKIREQGGGYISAWRKLVCFYDYLKYRGKEPNV